MEVEMQHLLAATITKILERKSIRDSVANLRQLIVNELELTMDKGPLNVSAASQLTIQASQKLLKSLKK